uniref:Uncharacterized protein n=1 Tax=Arundo donax TaxID=35708 RepID=A0A0A9B1W1_ARUDO
MIGFGCVYYRILLVMHVLDFNGLVLG